MMAHATIISKQMRSYSGLIALFSHSKMNNRLQGRGHLGSGWNSLTHWGRDKMAAISQTMFSNPFY